MNQDAKKKDYRPASFLGLGQTVSLLIWGSDYSTEIMVDGPWYLSCAPRARKTVSKTGTMSAFWLFFFGMKIPIIFLFLPIWKGFFQQKQFPRRHNFFLFLAQLGEWQGVLLPPSPEHCLWMRFNGLQIVSGIKKHGQSLTPVYCFSCLCFNSFICRRG